MKLYWIEHEGLYMGGYALINADNQQEAIKIFSNNSEFKINSIRELPNNCKGVLNYWDGDY